MTYNYKTKISVSKELELSLFFHVFNTLVLTVTCRPPIIIIIILGNLDCIIDVNYACKACTPKGIKIKCSLNSVGMLASPVL